jgi:hypothetical protein
MNRITLITLGSALAACSSSSTTPTTEQYDDTAQAIASTTSTSGGGGDVASMSDAVTISLGTMPPGFSLTGDGHFHGSRLGVDYSYAITCKNLAGTVGVCGPTTDQASVDVSWSGNLTSTNADASVSRTGSWAVTGLQTDTATFSGDSTLSFDATLRSVFRPGAMATYMFDASASYNAVRISTQQHQVIDGSASFDLTAHHQVTGTPNNDVDASFASTSERAITRLAAGPLSSAGTSSSRRSNRRCRSHRGTWRSGRRTGRSAARHRSELQLRPPA